MRYCSLASGSSGNCHFVEGAGVRILVDLGLSMRAAESNLRAVGIAPESIRAVFVTHEHSDHIRGIGAWSRKYHIPIFATAGTWKGIGNSQGTIDPGRAYSICPGRGYHLGTMRVEPFQTFHDAQEPVGYVFSDPDGEKIVIMTDTGIVTPDMAGKMQGARIVALESNHDVEMLKNGPYPYLLKRRILGNTGHLSNEACARLASRLLSDNPDCEVFLSHLSDENNTPETALETVLDQLHETFGSTCMDQHIHVSKRDIYSEMIDTLRQTQSGPELYQKEEMPWFE